LKQNVMKTQIAFAFTYLCIIHIAFENTDTHSQ